jgi:hypothetical protein
VWVAFARAHAKAADVTAICGYLGGSGQFGEAIGDFSIAYADQAERDHTALKAAVRKGKITVSTRRFCARPPAVLLEATGSAAP